MRINPIRRGDVRDPQPTNGRGRTAAVDARRDRDAPRDDGPDQADSLDLGDRPPVVDPSAVVARQRAAFGGVKIGAAFFGWLTALGTAVLLTALLAAAGTAIRVAGGRTDPANQAGLPGTDARTDVAVIVILFVAYYCGGYVAGRMARFNGVRQGLAVWIWAVLAALVVAAVGAIVGTRWDVLAALYGYPRLPADGSHLTGNGVLAGVLAVLAALAGALLGGLAGMRFHRRVDRAGLPR